jgi:Cu(I)/Ag(I) efflux system membrane fusion protein
MKTYLITLIALFLSVSNMQAQEKKEHSHDAHLSALISEYMSFKNALVTDDFEKAQKHILNFTKEVKSNNEMNEHKEHQEMHASHHSKMLAAVEVASSAKNIEDLRNSLEGITLELVKAVENQGYDKSALYVQFCPMANNGKGAKWMSDKEEIQNPYFGKKMHKCGATVKEIGNN